MYLTSYSLIERVHDLADEASWVEFLGIYQPVVYRMARRRGLQDADAQDVIQQVFASIARSIDGWKAGKDRPPFRAWLTTVSRNAITNALARKPRDPDVIRQAFDPAVINDFIRKVAAGGNGLPASAAIDPSEPTSASVDSISKQLTRLGSPRCLEGSIQPDLALCPK